MTDPVHSKFMEDLKYILENDPDVKMKTFKKGDIIQHAGMSKAHRYFVKKGLLRSFIVDSKGKEHIFIFAPEGWIIADVESLEYNTSVELFIDCLEDSEVFVFDKEISSYDSLSREEISEHTRLLYRRMGVLQRRVLMLLSSSAKDRYAYFLLTYPELPNRVPLRMIASYLGITPQALSTIMSAMATPKSK